MSASQPARKGSRPGKPGAARSSAPGSRDRRDARDSRASREAPRRSTGEGERSYPASGASQPRSRRDTEFAGRGSSSAPAHARSEGNAPRGSSSRGTAPARARSETGRASNAAGANPARPYAPGAARIEQVRSVLGEVLQWEYPADAVLSHWFRAHPRLGMRDRGEVAEAVFDVLRHLRRYRQYAESGEGAAGRRLAILGLASVLTPTILDTGLEPGERAWLDHVGAIDPFSLPPAVRHSVPDWLEERLASLEDSEQLIQALNQPAPLDLRVNPLKADRDEMLAVLKQGPAGAWDPQPTPYSPWGIRMRGKPAINRWPMFEQGLIEVQDEGSQILALLVAPRRGEMIIDYCAGAGGKTMLLGALMRSTGRLYAFDVSAARLARAKPRFARSGLSNIVPVVISATGDQRVKRLRGKAHRVLVDAPCSGLGTLRRNPDLKWRQHPGSLDDLRRTQADILRQAASCVAPGGRLVYATCSVLPEENEAQVEAFLNENPGFKLLDASEIVNDRCKNLTLEGPWLKMRPDRHGTDGFFAAVMVRET
ncbi:RsmB/NOP family class I SAM-dependent RNA methyltransferase [Pusillimonas sp. TS35]|nr:RsmB/NOP family class I SAM-dependent RNA methyltransferase [Paracandidimonas lactea]MYN14690.1 RsmB/NOP family class I SAM-dependent RNA methyltransferase [Pusillimonas sp. TS35]